MKSLAIILSALLLFSTTGVAFSQTTNSTEQCKTVMHEQIGPKKYSNGTIKLEKSLIPIKVCKATDGSFTKKLKPKPETPNDDPTCPLRTKEQCESWQNRQEQIRKNPLLKVDKILLDSIATGTDPVKIKIKVKGTIGDFKPLDSKGKPIALPKLTQEQRNLVIEQRKAQADSYQKDLINFIKNNAGTITHTDYHINVVSARVPSSLVEKLAERDDVLRISQTMIPKLERINK